MFEISRKTLAEGMAEILDEFGKGKPLQFMDISNIINPRTGRGYSPNTVSGRIKKLMEDGMIKRVLLPRVVNNTRRGRGRVGYIIMKRGKLILKATRIHEKKLADLMK